MLLRNVSVRCEPARRQKLYDPPLCPVLVNKTLTMLHNGIQPLLCVCSLVWYKSVH